MLLIDPKYEVPVVELRCAKSSRLSNEKAKKWCWVKVFYDVYSECPWTTHHKHLVLSKNCKSSFHGHFIYKLFSKFFFPNNSPDFLTVSANDIWKFVFITACNKQGMNSMIPMGSFQIKVFYYSMIPCMRSEAAGLNISLCNYYYLHSSTCIVSTKNQLQI